jgi:hypothetical protein
MTRLINEQYADYVELRQRYNLDQTPVSEYTADSTNITISRIVGDMVDKATEGAIDFGTFDNCREYGLTFTLGLWTFCVYEHRNSDEICIEGCLTAEMKSYGPYGGISKYDTLTCDGPEEYKAVADKLTSMLRLVSDGGEHSRADLRAVSEVPA